MEQRTRLETLVSLRNDQLEKTINREVSVKMLEVMMKEDADRVLTVTPDLDTLTPKAITVRMRMKEMQEGLTLDQMRLETLEKMIKDEEYLNSPKEPNEGPDQEAK